jgi:hypothetical protein
VGGGSPERRWGERGRRRRRRASLWRRREREKEEGRVARGTDSGRVFTGQAIYRPRGRRLAGEALGGAGRKEEEAHEPVAAA